MGLGSDARPASSHTMSKAGPLRRGPGRIYLVLRSICGGDPDEALQRPDGLACAPAGEAHRRGHRSGRATAAADDRDALARDSGVWRSPDDRGLAGAAGAGVRHSGRAAGEVVDLAVDRSSGCVRFVVVSFGAFLGLRTRFHPIPWGLLRWDTKRDGYVTPLSVEELDAAPSLSADDLEALGAGDRAWRERLAAYYNPLLQLGAL